MTVADLGPITLALQLAVFKNISIHHAHIKCRVKINLMLYQSIALEELYK